MKIVRRGFRVAFALVALLSLGIAVAAVGLWVRGRFAQDEFRWHRDRIVRDVLEDGDVHTRRSTLFATSGRGGLAVGHGITWREGVGLRRGDDRDGTSFGYDAYDPAYPIYPADEPPENGAQHTFGGFQVRTSDDGSGAREPLMRSGEHVFGADGRVVMVEPRVPLDRRETLVVVPLWAVVVAGSVAPAAWLARRRRQRRTADRRARGACLQCGYDLRSGGGHDRCPECGVATAA